MREFIKVMKALRDPNRLKIIKMLQKEDMMDGFAKTRPVAAGCAALYSQRGGGLVREVEPLSLIPR